MAKCPKCKKVISDKGVDYCPECGAKIKKQEKITEPIKPSQAWGIAALVLSILGLIFLFFPPLGLVFAITAIVFSSLQRKHEPTGVATAALVIGIIGIIINAIILLATIIMAWGVAFTKKMQSQGYTTILGLSPIIFLKDILKDKTKETTSFERGG